MKKFSLILFFFLTWQLCDAHKEDFYFLTGTIGDKNVGVRIDEYGDQCMMRFFYIGDLKESILNGELGENRTFSFELSHSQTTVPASGVTGGISIHEFELNRWTGVYVDTVGHKMEIYLEPIKVEELNHPFIEAIIKYKIDPYTALRTKTINFTTISTSRLKKGGKIIHVKDNLTALSFFRVEFSKHPHQSDSINNCLIAAHLKHIQNALSCDIKNDHPVYELSYDIHVLSHQYISYSEHTKTNCLGGVLIPQTEIFNKWLINADDIILEDLLWFGKKGEQNVRYASHEWHQYRYKVFGDSLLHVMTNLYPDKIHENELNPCGYDKAKGWQFPVWHLLPKGIYFQYTILSKNPNCNNSGWTIVPWKRIQNFLLFDPE